MKKMTEEEKGKYLEYLENAYNDVARYANLPRIKRWTVKGFHHPLKSIQEIFIAKVISRIVPDGFLVRSSTFFRFKMWLNLISSYGLWLYGYYPNLAEIRLAQFLIKNLKNNSVFFDVGANNGFFSLLALRIIDQHAGGSVHAFEASPRTFKVLTLNNDCGIITNDVGCWSVSGVGSFYEFKNADKLGESSLYKDASFNNLVREVCIKLVSLDDYCVAHQCIPNIVKIDTEGAELNVIEGSIATILKNHPIFVVEIQKGRNSNNSKGQTCINLLMANGYGVNYITTYGHLLPIDNIEKYFKESMCGLGYDNLVLEYVNL
jgi:FkbM family methyltransferase